MSFAWISNLTNNLGIGAQMDKTTTLSIYTDGGSRGNPGPSAFGVHIENQSGLTLDEIGQNLGTTTNNVAEYSAIVAGLSWVVKNKSKMPGLTRINFFMDSQLASSQLNGFYKIKNTQLRELLFSAKEKEAEIDLPVHYSHIPREQNKKSDRMVNLALDNRLKE